MKNRQTLPIAVNLGARIVQLRQERGLLQDRLAALAGVNKGYLSAVETGQRVPSLEFLLKLCLALELQIFDLFVVPDRSPLERLLEDLRLGGSPAAQALRAQHGLSVVRRAERKKGALQPRPKAAAPSRGAFYSVGLRVRPRRPEEQGTVPGSPRTEHCGAIHSFIVVQRSTRNPPGPWWWVSCGRS